MKWTNELRWNQSQTILLWINNNNFLKFVFTFLYCILLTENTGAFIPFGKKLKSMYISPPNYLNLHFQINIHTCENIVLTRFV